MEKVTQIRKKISPIQKQLIKFTLIGVLAVAVDLAAYYFFLNILPFEKLLILSNEAISKGLSFLCGMTVTYTFNKLWTWKQKNKSKKRLIKFSILYGISLLVNITTNSTALFLFQLPEFEWIARPYFFAFLSASCASAGFNFLGQKFWVFSSKIDKKASPKINNEINTPEAILEEV